MTALVVFPGGGSPYDKRYEQVCKLIELGARQLGYDEVDISISWPGQVNAKGEYERDGMGRSEQFAPVVNVAGKAGDIVDVEITGHNDKTLLGMIRGGTTSGQPVASAMADGERMQ